jgi:hypothetical protein
VEKNGVEEKKKLGTALKAPFATMETPYKRVFGLVTD